MPESQESNQTPKRSAVDGERPQETFTYTATSDGCRDPEDTVTNKSAFDKSPSAQSQCRENYGKARNIPSQSSSDYGLPGLETSGGRSEPYPSRLDTPERGRGPYQDRRPEQTIAEGIHFSETTTEIKRVTVETKRTNSVDIKVGGAAADNVINPRNPVRKSSPVASIAKPPRKASASPITKSNRKKLDHPHGRTELWMDAGNSTHYWKNATRTTGGNRCI